MSPLLAFDDRLIAVKRVDVESRLLADRHYSRRTPGHREFMDVGETLVLRDAAGLVVFGWLCQDPEKRWDGQTGLYCSIFRNESPRLASEIVLESEQHALTRWPETQRFYTYIDPRKVASPNPGYCFKVAGWKHIGYSRDGKHLLAKEWSDEH